MLASATASSAALYPETARPIAQPAVASLAARTAAAWNASGCLRGLRYGIAIELAASAMIYGIWRLVHLL